MPKRVLFLALAYIVFNHQSAWAHTELLNSTIKPGSTISFLPGKLTLSFSEPLLKIVGKKVNWVKVTDPKQKLISTQSVSTTDRLSVELSNNQGLKGIYKVTYRAVAEDGHIKNGAFTFTIK